MPEMLAEATADTLRHQMLDIMTGRELPGSALTEVIEIWAHTDAHTDHTDHVDGAKHTDS